MKNIFFSTVVYLLLNLFGGQEIFAQPCFLDSLNYNNKNINDFKFIYDQTGRLSTIKSIGNIYPIYVSGVIHNDLKYNGNNLLDSVVSYGIDNLGDTVLAPYTSKKFYYANGLLSKVYKRSYDISVNLDDFVWSNDKIIEFKYYYLSCGIVDSSQTRVLHFTYTNNNVSHFLYKELVGTTYSDDDFLYDNEYNPFYKSEIALANGDLLQYSCINNWINSSGGGSRNIIYNSFNYPINVVTNWNGNIIPETYTYNNCFNPTGEEFIANMHGIELFPNPSNDFIKIKNNSNQRIKQVRIIDLNGVKLIEESNTDLISIKGLKAGLYIIECVFENFILRKKIIVNAN